jgi:UDP-glucose 4-epimerase
MKDFFANKCAVVTGGCGFIGTHLVQHLDQLGLKEIRIIDSLKYGNSEYIDLLRTPTRLERYSLQSLDDGIIERTLNGADILFHLAAEKHNSAIDIPLELLKANVDGSFHLFEHATRAGVSKIVFSSSLYACGRMGLPAMKEGEMPNPQTVYGISKLTGEYLLKSTCKKTSTDWIALRYFFTYGPGQFKEAGYKSVIIKNFQRLLNEDAPVINGDGNQALDYIYVDDVVEATLQAMALPVSGEIINVGSGLAVTVNELTRHMISSGDFKTEPIMGPIDFTHNTHRVACIDKLRDILSFSPKTSFPIGLKRVLDSLK